RCSRRARPGEEIAERAGIEAFETIRRLLFERAQGLNVFLDRNASGLRVAAAGRRFDARGKRNRHRQHRRTKSCCSSPFSPGTQQMSLDGEHVAVTARLRST